MSDWWSKLFGWLSTDKPTAEAPVAEPARWLAADDPGNPFEFPILDLMITQSLMAASDDPAAASRAISWSQDLGASLNPQEVLAEAPISCDLRYPISGRLPDGLLFAPETMDQKWVICFREGRIIVARSWTGDVAAVAETRYDNDCLVIYELRIAASTPLLTDNPAEVFDWLIRSHALDQRLPFPADNGTAALFEQVPHTAFSAFGNVIFCAARMWAPPEPPLLHSTGRVVQLIRQEDPDGAVAAVQAGEDIDAPSTFDGYTALHTAIVQGDLTSIQKLLAAGADIDRRSDSGMFALGIAIVHGHGLDVLDAIDAAGADLHQRNQDGFGALHAAAEVDRGDVIPWLVERGLEIEACTRHGHTALHVACGLGHLNAVRAVVKVGAKLDAPDANGRTAMEIARDEGHEAVAAWIRQQT
ncbi:MAG: ankyrin repeat domain-containing protein [Myxococcota bacterium]